MVEHSVLFLYALVYTPCLALPSLSSLFLSISHALNTRWCSHALFPVDCRPTSIFHYISRGRQRDMWAYPDLCCTVAFSFWPPTRDGANTTRNKQSTYELWDCKFIKYNLLQFMRIEKTKLKLHNNQTLSLFLLIPFIIRCSKTLKHYYNIECIWIKLQISTILITFN